MLSGVEGILGKSYEYDMYLRIYKNTYIKIIHTQLYPTKYLE